MSASRRSARIAAAGSATERSMACSHGDAAPHPPGSVPEPTLDIRRRQRDGPRLVEATPEPAGPAQARCPPPPSRWAWPGASRRARPRGACLQPRPVGRTGISVKPMRSSAPTRRLLVQPSGEVQAISASRMTSLPRSSCIAASVAVWRAARYVARNSRQPVSTPCAGRHVLGGGDGPLGGTGPSRGVVIEPETDVGLQGVETDGGLRLGNGNIAGAIEVPVRLLPLPRDKCGTRGLELGSLAQSHVVANSLTRFHRSIASRCRRGCPPVPPGPCRAGSARPRPPPFCRQSRPAGGARPGRAVGAALT